MAVTGAYLLCVLIWGSTWYAIELQLGQVAPEWSLAYRFGLASLGMFAICFALKKPLKFSLHQHLWLGLLGATLFSGNYILVYYGTGYLTSGLVAVLFSLMAFFNILFAHIFLKQKSDSTLIFGAALGIMGLVLVFWPELASSSSGNDDTLKGIGLVVGATIIASAGNTVVGSKTFKTMPILPANAWSMAYGTALIAFFALAQGTMPTFDDRISYYLSLVHLSFLGTIVAFTALLWMIGKIGVGRSGYISVLVPLVALTISTFVEDYIWTLPSTIGLAMTLSGIVFIMLKRQAKTA